MGEPEQPIEQEAGELLAAVREHLLWQQASGATGLARAPTTNSHAVAAVSPEPGLPRPPVLGNSGNVATGLTLPRAASIPPSAPGPLPLAGLQTPSEPATVHVMSGQGLSAAEKNVTLDALRERVKNCTGCVLCQQRTQTVFSRGNPVAELMFVGEGPGADEDAQGEPFVGKAGQLLDKMIEAMGFLRDDVYIANIVKCRPPENRAPEPGEIDQCMPYLHEQISIVAPRVIIAMGATAVKGLLGATDGITKIRGKWKLYRGSIAVMPTFHPAYLLRKEEAKRDVWADLKLVLGALGRSVPEKKK